MAKRMSLEEKKRLALQHLHESKSVFMPKELPNLWYRAHKISKSKQGFDKLIEALEDDSLIHHEKIGTSKYIWSFTSEQRVINQTKISKLEKEIESIEKETKKWKEKLEKAKEERKGEKRKEELIGLEKLQQAVIRNEEKLKSYQGCNPQDLEKYTNSLQIAKDAAERWTDNVFQIVKFIKAKKSCSDSDIFKHFGLPQDFDYLE